MVLSTVIDTELVERLAGTWERVELTPIRGEGFRIGNRACLLAAMHAEAGRLDPAFDPEWEEGLAAILDLHSDEWVRGMERGYEGQRWDLHAPQEWQDGYRTGAAVAARVFGGAV